MDEGSFVISSARKPEKRAFASQAGQLPLGARYLGEGRTSFCVWAPNVRQLEVVLLGAAERSVSLKPRAHGYFEGIIEDVPPGTTYVLALDGEKRRPDPASRYQPDSVHGPSAVVTEDFEWKDQTWRGLRLRDYILYELHVGTASAQGTFDGVIGRLDELKELGVTALELMPVAQFPGERNWGYDGVFPYAVQNSYGGPAGLKRLVNACHQRGLAVVLDVVYNHFGPEGNYFRDFGPYFTASHRTPWGDAINFDGEQSDEVRRFFLENALRWQTEFHLDALRLDAVHAIRDCSAASFLQELARATHARAVELGRRFYLIAESDSNDARVIRPELLGGLGLDAQWSDDFHHSLHVLLTGERDSYYADFAGVRDLAKVYAQGYCYTGQYSVFRKRKHGNSPYLTSAKQFVVYSQNHDQVGNRLLGERLSALVGLEKLKLAAGAVVLSPFVPMLFMGEEYGEPAPFQYVVSHGDPELIEAIRKGRREEFAGFRWQKEMPDPAAAETFEACVLSPELGQHEGNHQVLSRFYREVIRLRKCVTAISRADKPQVNTIPYEAENALLVGYQHETGAACLLLNFSSQRRSLQVPLSRGIWLCLLDSAAGTWDGPGTAIHPRLTSAGMPLDLELQPCSVVLLGSDGLR